MNIQKTTALLIFCLSIQFSTAQTETFTYTGAVQTYTVPDGITQIEIETWGAQGGSSVGMDGLPATGGLGGYSIGELAVIPGQVLEVFVGGAGGPSGPGGFNGGGIAASDLAAAGGGASDVRVSPYALTNRVIVGGGGGGGSFGLYGRLGGEGGGLIGGTGAEGVGYLAGTGGTQVAGGAAGSGYGIVSPGSFGFGGGTGHYRNAGGGGGWYGGGSGSGSGAAGGGSSYIDGVTSGSTTAGLRSGNGLVLITPSCDPLEITVSADELCDGDELTLDATSENGGVISWDGGATDGVAFVPGSTGVITYTATSDSDEDCYASVDIEVYELPAVIAAVDDESICLGESVVFSESGDADSYSWDPAEVESGVPYSPEVGVVTYVLTGTDLTTGCENESSIEVEVFALPLILAGDDFAICNGDEAVLFGDGAGIGGTYSWDGGVIDAIAFNPLVTAEYTVTGTDINGCSNTDAIELTVNPLPEIEAGENDSICLGSSVVLMAAGLDDADDYVWSDAVVNGSPFIPESTQFYYVSGTDDNGCTNNDSVLVFVYDLPTIVAGEDRAICYGLELVLNAEGAGVGGSYEWSDGVFDGIAFYPESSGMYIVVGTDENGCENTDSLLVEVYDLPPIDAGDDQEVCTGDEVTLTAVGAGLGGVYEWNEGVINEVGFIPISTNEYIVIGTDENGCSNTDTVRVTINEIPIINAGEDIEICEGYEVELNAVGAGEDGVYDWDNGVENGESFTPTSEGTITVIGIDENGCVNQDSLSIFLNESPNVNAGPNLRVCLETEVILSVVDYDESLIYTWSDEVENGVPFIGYNVASNWYSVTALNEVGCQSMDEVFVEVVNCDTILIHPTGFSPNGDGVNDYLVFKGIDLDLEVYLAVFNEWGMLLFESSNYQDDWDGTNELGISVQPGMPLPAGTYYYILKYGDEAITNYLYIER